MNESVIWLITVGKIDQAMSAVKRTAKINRRNLDKNIIEEIKVYYLVSFVSLNSSKLAAL